MNLQTQYIYILLIFIFTQSTLSLPSCLYYMHCKECELCNITDINYDFSYCNYANLFCIDYSFETRIFKHSTINEYAKNLRTDTEINNFCGNEIFEIEPNKKEETITIFTSKDKTFPKNKIVHCNFNITKGEENKFKEISLYFEISKKENPNNNILKFNITFIKSISGAYNVDSDVDSFTDEKIRNETYEYYLDDKNRFQLLIDFNDMTSTETDENFEIRSKRKIQLK